MTARIRQYPDLEQARGPGFQVVLGMADAGAGAHDLNVARLGAPLVAQTVLMRDGTFTHIGDDFHVGVRMQRETRARLDGIVVPDAQAAPVHTLRIVIACEGEMVPGVQPAVIGGTQRRERAVFHHCFHL